MMILGFCLLASLSLGPQAATPAVPSYHLIKRMTVGGEGGWDYLTVDSAAHRLYVTRGTHVMVLDADSLNVVGVIPDTPGVHGVALASSLGKGFTSNGGDNSVTVVDLKSLKALARIKIEGNRPDAILYDPAARRVFTFNGGSRDSTVIDATTDKVVATVPLDGRPEFAVTDGRGMVYCNIEDKSEIAAIDARKLTVKSRWSISPGDGPSGLAIDARRHRLYSVCGNGMMIVSDADAGTAVATPAIGRGPDAAAFDPDYHIAFSSNGADGTLTVVKEESPTSFAVTANVRTAQGARTMALDPKTHRIYLVTATPRPPSQGEQTQRFRRSYEPGSFEVLILGP